MPETNELKPIVGRIRHQQKKREKMIKEKVLKEGLISLSKEKNLLVTFLKEHSMDKRGILDTSKILKLKTLLLEKTRKILSKKPYLSMKEDEIHTLLRSIDPFFVGRQVILSLPETLSKIYEVSDSDIRKREYGRDKLWLCVQWQVDDTPNPFLSRPCSGAPCLGEFIRKASGGLRKKPLPEIVPLKTLEWFIDARSRGVNTKDFKKALQARRRQPRPLLCPLARDVWSHPKCAICHMGESYQKYLSALERRHEISLEEYQKFMMIHFPGLLPLFTIKGESLFSDFVLSESQAMLPKEDVILVGPVLKAIVEDEKGEIVIDTLYPKKSN